MSSAPAARTGRPPAPRDVTLLELLDRLLEGGVVVSGEITLAVADIELVHLKLRALIASVDTLEKAASEASPPPQSSEFAPEM